MKKIIFYSMSIIIIIVSIFLLNCTANKESSSGSGSSGGSSHSGSVTAPVILTRTPMDNSTDVATDTTLSITFNENISKGSGNIEIYDSTDAVFETIDVTSASVSVSGAEVTITPSSSFSPEDTYYILIDNTAFRNSSNINFAGISVKTDWNFTIISGPIILNKSPENNSTDVATDTTLSITFNENISKGSGNIEIYDSTDAVFETIDVTSASVSVSGAEVTITPSSSFSPEETYYILIDNTAFRNSSNEYFSGIVDKTTWNFITEKTIFLIESFDYGSYSDDLDNVTTNWIEEISGTNKIQYNSTGYSYTNYSSGYGGKASGDSDLTTGQAMKIDLSSNVNSGTIYFAFILDGISADSGTSGFGIVFYNNNTQLGGVSLKGKNPGNNYRILSHDEVNNLAGNVSGTCLVVLKYDFSTNLLTGFFDPDVTGSETGEKTLGDFTSSPWINITSIVIDQTLNGAASPTNNYAVDEIKVVKYWELLEEK